MDYNKLSQTAHAAAKANGWYEKVQPINTYLMLTKSELYEALDAFRANKYCTHPDLFILQEELNIFYDILEESHKKEVVSDFKENIKDTFEDEIADTVIRICDFCGWYGIELGEVKMVNTWSKGAYDLDLVDMDILITNLFTNCQVRTPINYKTHTKNLMNLAFIKLLGMLESIAEVYNFDLEQHINLKLAYNATRGYKHGNKVL